MKTTPKIELTTWTIAPHTFCRSAITKEILSHNIHFAETSFEIAGRFLVIFL